MGQIARGVDRKLLARVDAQLTRALPEGARETGRSIDVYRIASGGDVFVATALLQWKTARGREDAYQERATGRGAGAPNAALRALLDRMQDPQSPAPVASRPTPAAKPRPIRPKRSRSTERGMVTAARRLLGYLVPAGASRVVRSVTVAPSGSACVARASVSWSRAGRVASREVTATGRGLDPHGDALARLLAKLERVPLRVAE